MGGIDGDYGCTVYIYIYIYIWVYITCNMMGVYKVNMGVCKVYIRCTWFYIRCIQLFQKTLSEEKQKAFKPRPKGHASMSLRTVWNVFL